MENNSPNPRQGIEQDEEQIDLKELIFKYLKFWPYIVICAFLGLFCAFLVNRYATPIYKIDASVVVNDEPPERWVRISLNLRDYPFPRVTWKMK